MSIRIGIGRIAVYGGTGSSWTQYWADKTPTTLVLSRISSTTIRLNWLNAGAGYDGTSIERSTDGVTYAEVDTVASGVVQYDAVSVNNTTGRFYYRVRCYKGTNYSPYSNVASLVAEAEIVTYITGLATPLYESNIWNLNKLVTDIKSGLSIANLSDTFDLMYVFAGQTQESSLKNLVENDFHSTLVNAPVFTAYEGLLGNTTNQYINSNYKPTADSTRLTVNSASLGVYVRTDIGSLTQYDAGCDSSGTDQFRLNSRNGSNSVQGYISTDDYIGLANFDSLGMHQISRTDANTVSAYKQGNINTEAANIAINIQPDDLTFMASDKILYSGRQISFGYCAKGLSQAQMASIETAIEAYMDANGKGVVA